MLPQRREHLNARGRGLRDLRDATWTTRTDEKPGHGIKRRHRGRKPDANKSGTTAATFRRHHVFESFRRDHQHRSAFVFRECVKFIGDKKSRRPERGDPPRLAQQQREALGGCHENVRWFPTLRCAFLLRRVAGAGADPQPRPTKFIDRFLKIFAQIVRERAQRRDINGDNAVQQFTGVVGVREVIEHREERGECFSTSGWRGQQERVTMENLRNRMELSRREVGESFLEPRGKLRVKLLEKLPFSECRRGKAGEHRIRHRIGMLVASRSRTR